MSWTHKAQWQIDQLNYDNIANCGKKKILVDQKKLRMY